MDKVSIKVKGALLSVIIFLMMLSVWHLATMPKTFYKQLSDPFYDKGPNDKGIGIQLAYSLARVSLGFLLALLVALPVGFLIGMSPLLSAAFNPFIQILKPISPLAWMPIALYTIKDSSISGVFVIFICSIWPMFIAWLVIVAAEMLVGGTGIGYFLWNEWNNLAISSVIFAIVVIGFVGMLLDMFFAKLQKMVTYAD